MRLHANAMHVRPALEPARPALTDHRRLFRSAFLKDPIYRYSPYRYNTCRSWASLPRLSVQHTASVSRPQCPRLLAVTVYRMLPLCDSSGWRLPVSRPYAEPCRLPRVRIILRSLAHRRQGGQSALKLGTQLLLMHPDAGSDAHRGRQRASAWRRGRQPVFRLAPCKTRVPRPVPAHRLPPTAGTVCGNTHGVCYELPQSARAGSLRVGSRQAIASVATRRDWQGGCW